MQTTKSEQITAIILTLIMVAVVFLFDRNDRPSVAIKDDPACILTADTSACKAYWRETLAAKVKAGDLDPLGLFASDRPLASPSRP